MRPLWVFELKERRRRLKSVPERHQRICIFTTTRLSVTHLKIQTANFGSVKSRLQTQAPETITRLLEVLRNKTRTKEQHQDPVLGIDSRGGHLRWKIFWTVCGETRKKQMLQREEMCNAEDVIIARDLRSPRSTFRTVSTCQLERYGGFASASQGNRWVRYFAPVSDTKNKNLVY